jgi:hypothetical protein
MTRNLYYHIIYQRPNNLVEWFLGFFYQVSSWPRLLLEVFIRRNMGERYFSLFGVGCIFLLLVGRLLFNVVLAKMGYSYSKGTGAYLYSNTVTMGAFAVVFLYFGIQRSQEIKRLPSVFDFKRFSLSPGNSLLVDPNYRGKIPAWFIHNPRRIATVSEPGLFFLAGLLLLLAGQSIGTILLVCSIIYSLSYVATYRMGDNLVMDHIDNIIASEEMDRSFSQDLPPSETRGFATPGRRPADPNYRRKVAQSFMEPDDDERVLAL